MKGFLTHCKAYALSLMFISTTALTLMSPVVAHAAVTNATASPRISFTFDDGLTSASTQAQPTLAQYGINGTDYVITGCVGMTTAPNTCRANTDNTYMTWAQIKALQSAGWEIGSHTVDHDCLASSAKQDPDDCQTNTLTTAQVDTELSQSKATLAANGINATDIAPPYGDYSNTVMAEIAKYYSSMRQFKNDASNANVWPYSDYYLQDVTVQEGIDTPASIETRIDNAIANNQWLVLTFHDIQTSPSKKADDYQYGTQELAQIAAYVQAKQNAGLIHSVNVNQGLVTSDNNLLPNSSFNDGIADGWATDNASAITKDTANNGSYPDSTNSIKLTSASANAHLFSPQVSVDPSTTYMLKNFLNVQKITSGEVAFYVDEYDANGNWISGQYKTAENSSFVEDMNFTYKPSSVAVSKASLQVIVAGTGITAYLDNTQFFPLTVAPVQTNLLPNSTFDSGISAGWTTDDAGDIMANAANLGSPANPVNSISLKSNTTKNGHLFSPAVAVDSTKSYSLSSYLNITAMSSGEVGFYIDEYDANGNWISGQYKSGDHTIGAGTVGFSYTPSSANVKTASLQIITVANSGTQAYFDNPTWVVN